MVQPACQPCGLCGTLASKKLLATLAPVSYHISTHVITRSRCVFLCWLLHILCLLRIGEGAKSSAYGVVDREVHCVLCTAYCVIVRNTWPGVRPVAYCYRVGAVTEA